MKRRHLLTLLLLSGCVSHTSNSPISAEAAAKLAEDISLAVNGADPLVSYVTSKSTPKLTRKLSRTFAIDRDSDDDNDSDKSTLQTLFQTVKADLNNIKQDITNIQTSPYTREAINVLNALVNVAASFPLVPEPYHSILQALVVILPVIETEAGVVEG